MNWNEKKDIHGILVEKLKIEEFKDLKSVLYSY